MAVVVGNARALALGAAVAARDGEADGPATVITPLISWPSQSTVTA